MIASVLLAFFYAAAPASPRSALAIPPRPVAHSVPRPDAPTMDQARRHLDAKRWEKAVAAYREILQEEPGNGTAWYLLAYCLSSQGEHAAALECNQKSLLHGGPKASVLYNMACLFEKTGELDSAEDHLQQAIHEGYIDFDWIAKDADLQKTLARGNVPVPEPRKIQSNKGRNGVEIPYELLLPEEH